METQDNGFLKEIDGVRKEKERLTAAKLFSLTSWLLASSLLLNHITTSPSIPSKDSNY